MGQPYIGIHDADGSQLLPLLVEPTTDPILVEKFELSPPSVRATEDNRPQASGIYDRTMFTGNASVSLEGIFIGDAAAAPWSYADQLKQLSRPSSRVYFHVQRADWDAPRRILVRGDNPTVAYTDLQPAFQFGYKAPTGLLEAVDETVVPLFPANLASPGISEPISEPVFTAPGGTAGGFQVDVDGTAPSFPVIDLYGPAAGTVSVEYATTGEVWQSRPSTVIEAGHFWRIDFDAHTIHVDGDPSLSRGSQFDFINSTWWALQPGTAAVSLTVASPGVGCHAVMRFRPSYTI